MYQNKTPSKIRPSVNFGLKINISPILFSGKHGIWVYEGLTLLSVNFAAASQIRKETKKVMKLQTACISGGSCLLKITNNRQKNATKTLQSRL